MKFRRPRRTFPLLAWLSLALGACASPTRPTGADGAAPPAARQSAVGQVAIDRAATRAESPSPAAAAAPLRLPDRITLPAIYRVMVLDGHLALVRETDDQSLRSGGTSLRVVTGEIARGEIAYQPAVLPQELAAELAANRESTARMNDALDAVMRRSRELSEQAGELAGENRRLEALLKAEEDRLREIEGRKESGGPNL